MTEGFGIVLTKTGLRSRVRESITGRPVSVVEPVGLSEYQGPVLVEGEEVVLLASKHSKTQRVHKRDVVSMVLLR